MVLLLISVRGATSAEPTETADGLVDRARAALRAGDTDEALKLAEQAVAADATDADALALRAAVHEAEQGFKAAIADYTLIAELKSVQDSPRALAEVFDRRGSANFCAAEIERSIADFDRAIALDPAREPGHWRRGISYYYAGRFDDGARQFEGYQTVDDNDVENAVWRFLCQARARNLQTARDEMLKIGRDPRVPLMQVYDLFLDKTDEAAVLRATDADQPGAAELKGRNFYAELYLGLWDEVNDRPEKSLEHLRAAVEKHNIGGYMWQVAQVHLKLRG